MKNFGLFRSISIAVCICALALSGSGVSTQAAALTGLTPPGNSHWAIQRIASHWNAPTYGYEMPASHSFALDGLGHPQVVYGGDRLYYAYDNGSGWKSEVVDDYRDGVSNASIAFDSDNTPAASYCRNGPDTGYNPLMFAHKLNGVWQLTEVDDSAGACGSTSLVADSSGFHIAYFHPGAKEIRFASLSELNGWQTATITTGLDVWSGEVNLVSDANHVDHISFLNYAANKIEYVNNLSGSWGTPIIVTTTPNDRYNSLAVGSDLVPHIAFVATGKILTYASWNGDGFTTVPVRTGGANEIYGAVSLALDVDNVPYIGYLRDMISQNTYVTVSYSYKTGDTWLFADKMQFAQSKNYINIALTSASQPRFAYLDNNTLFYGLSDGTTTVIDAANQTIVNETSLVMGPADRGRVSYYENITGHLMRAFENPPSGWQIDLMDPAIPVGRYSSIAVGPDGAESIAYYDDSSRDLKVVTNPGTGYAIYTVDTGGTADVGAFPSLKVDSAGLCHISYFDTTNRDLKYAYMDSSFAWHTATLDGIRDVGKFSSLVLDGGGWPHIAYFNQTDGALKYTFQDAAGWHTTTLDDSINGRAGFGLSLAATPTGFGLAYAISDSINSLRYISCTPVAGWCTWYTGVNDTITTSVVPADGYGEIAGVSLVIDAAGKPYISYENSANKLAIASKTGAAWSFETVDPAGAKNGMHSSLAIDSNGRLHVSYIDAAYGSLMFAEQLPQLPLIKTYLPALKK
jgi:hypothetical protein